MQFSLSNEISADDMMKAIELSNQFHSLNIPLCSNQPNPEQQSQ
jgi:hypothetical protein